MPKRFWVCLSWWSSLQNSLTVRKNTFPPTLTWFCSHLQNRTGKVIGHSWKLCNRVQIRCSSRWRIESYIIFLNDLVKWTDNRLQTLLFANDTAISSEFANSDDPKVFRKDQKENATIPQQKPKLVHQLENHFGANKNKNWELFQNFSLKLIKHSKTNGFLFWMVAQFTQTKNLQHVTLVFDTRTDGICLQLHQTRDQQLIGDMSTGGLLSSLMVPLYPLQWMALVMVVAWSTTPKSYQSGQLQWTQLATTSCLSHTPFIMLWGLCSGTLSKATRWKEMSSLTTIHSRSTSTPISQIGSSSQKSSKFQNFWDLLV